MLARLQKILAFALITSAIGWASYFLHLGRPAWAGVGALSILFGYVFFLGIEFLVLFSIQRAGPDGELRASIAQLLRAWWGEAICAPSVFLWRQPFRSNAEPDDVSGGPCGQPGVVLVHGFVCNRGFWTPWMHALRAQRVRFVAVNLEPVFGSIDHYPKVIETAVARVEAATGMPVLLVGHSMGGLAIRAWLAQFSADARVRRVITIGSPHQGTWLARYAHTTNGKQMRLRGAWLTKLAAQESPSRRARFTCFYGHCDNIVFPTISGTLPDAENLHVPGIAHVHMAFQKTVFDELLRWLGHGVERKKQPRDPAALRQ